MTSIILSMLLAVAPSLLVLGGFLRVCTMKTRLVVVFVSGYFAVLPSLAAELLFSPLIATSEGTTGIVVHAFIVAGLVEESAKLALISLFTRRPRTATPDAWRISVAATAGMGFAAFENLLYAGNEFSTLILRGFTAVPLHLATSVIMATLINSGAATGRNRTPGALLTAVLLHGLYNTLLFLPPPAPFAVIPLVAVLVAITVSLIKIAFKGGPR